ncbi:ABC transporter permease [Pseudobacteroides cellulosolvens]|uniref:ABC-2 type transporter n=1 Tax=Pseudobacteroides cellulosolvens ATCC 35603 = DSM 2933 TaxID=398512 RepID=A0A0L6JRM1_9FIRM|nr:ABC-2 family transporter protein [Pseudobacteroides cellulosolvens]KNY28335.1 protein of unknown function DUF990 [Pseudobacteroides cellulosolvens ATCC 35603 = DSM 2933]
MINKKLKFISDSFIRHSGIVSVTLKSEMAYRFNFFTSIIWSMLTMALVYFLWSAIHKSSTSITITFQSLVTYVCLGQAFSFGRPGQRHVLMRIGHGIRSGDVLLDMVRPTDYQMLNFSGSFGSFIMDTLFVSLPSYLLAFFIFHIDPPSSPAAATGFIISLLGAFFLVFSLDFLIGIMAFWTRSVWGLSYAKMAIIEILAGTMVPLSLFPGWLQKVVLVLPFKDMAYTPLAIYVGQIEENAIIPSILIQFAWGVGLVLLTRLLWLKARRRLEIQGG